MTARRLSLLLLSAALGAALFPRPAALASPACTIQGTSGPDVLYGTPGRDVICARGGNDEVVARGGNDVLRGGTGADELVGGGGSDTLLGGDGSDELTGSRGSDTLTGGDGADLERGSAGSDVVEGGRQDDTLYGGPGDDALSGGSGDDSLYGGNGVDEVVGGPGRDGCFDTTAADSQRGCEDVTPPKLVELAFEPRVIDTSSQAQSIVVHAHITDDLSGVDAAGARSPGGHMWFRSPSGEQQVLGAFDETTRTAGTPQDGWYTTTVTFPRYAEQGVWSAIVYLTDTATNHTNLDSAELAQAGFPTTVEQVGAGDSGGPQMTSLSVTPTSVDTSSGAATLRFEATITDDLSGFTHGYVIFHSPSGDQATGPWFDAEDRVSGDALHGRYVETVTLPQYSEQGTWTFDYAHLHDAANNRAEIDAEDLVGGEFSTTFSQTGVGDEAPPQLHEFDFTPKTVDTSSSDQTIVFRAHITDDLSGLLHAVVVFESPAQDDQVLHSFDMTVNDSRTVRVSGDDRDAVYETTFTLPRYSQLGEWRLKSFSLQDSIGNVRYYSPQELQERGFPTSFYNGPS